MNFTDQPPIKPGFYAWKFHESHRERAREVVNNGGGNLICDDTRRNVKDVGGLWCHLLPASDLQPVVMTNESQTDTGGGLAAAPGSAQDWRECPGCKLQSVLPDGYCGRCRQTTLSPATDPGASVQSRVGRLTDGQFLVIERLRQGNASTLDLARLFRQTTYRACGRLHGMAKAGLIIKLKRGSRRDGDAIWALPPNDGTQRGRAAEAITKPEGEPRPSLE